jgi:hypothetical protein
LHARQAGTQDRDRCQRLPEVLEPSRQQVPARAVNGGAGDAQGHGGAADLKRRQNGAEHDVEAIAVGGKPVSGRDQDVSRVMGTLALPRRTSPFQALVVARPAASVGT